MKISGFLKQTLIDYPDKIAIEIFTAGCNYNCPTCHSKPVIKGDKLYYEDEIFSYLDKPEIKKFIEGVVICGGEPTNQTDLPDFCRKIKQREKSIKLDTNGSNPKVLSDLLNEKLIDYVAMDIKGPRDLYPQFTGRFNFDIKDIKQVESSMKLLSDSDIDYEFRTTVVPIVAENSELFHPHWISSKEYEDMAKWIADITQNNNHKYYLQKFVSRRKDEMLNERFAKENLEKEFHETPYEFLTEIKKAVQKYLPDCEVRDF